MVILITGASSGFGASIRKRLVAEGHRVYGTSRKPDASDPYELVLDVTDAKMAADVAGQIVRQEGRIDVLVNNAGMGIAGAAELAEPDEVARQIDTNFVGVANMCRAVLPYMRRQRSGRIINMSSIAGRFAVPYQGLYSASKFAIEGYSQALQIETLNMGIKIVCINPGDFNTGFTKARMINRLSLDDADYGESFGRVLRRVERDETTGGHPDMLAKRIARIVRAKHPHFHYIVAKDPIQALAVHLSVLLPKRLFFRVLRLFYGV